MGEDKDDVYIQVFGNKNELRQLCGFLDSPNSPNCRLEPAKINKGCYLTACRFSNLTGPELQESAKKILTMIRAFAKIEHGWDSQSIHIGRGKIVVDSEDAPTIIRSADGSVDGKADVSAPGMTGRVAINANVPTVISRDKDGNVVIDKPQVPQERQERWYDYYLDRCDDFIDNTVVYQALSRYAEKAQPLTLRRAYEIIYNAASKKDRLGKKDRLLKITGVTPTELSDFTHSLNEMIHIKTSDSKNNFVPMSLADATKFFGQRLLKPWLIYKQEIFRLADGYAKAKQLANILSF